MTDLAFAECSCYSKVFFLSECFRMSQGPGPISRVSKVRSGHLPQHAKYTRPVMVKEKETKIVTDTGSCGKRKGSIYFKHLQPSSLSRHMP
jgi:hypothetical protein